MTDEPRCTGACCSVFTMSKPYAELVADPTSVVDGEYILAMVEPLSIEEALARGGGADPTVDHYGCSLWDPETRLCTAYDDRPAMCRNFPYGRPCPMGCGVIHG